MESNKKRNWIFGGFSLIILLLEYFICRYLFFDLHGMREFPQLLLLVGVVFLLLAAAGGLKIFSISVLTGYPLGFICGMALQSYGTDPGGGRTSNGWIIWGGIFLACVVVGVLIDLAKRKVKK